jgi:cytochrome bd-type quinol oxidase subunit 2
MFTTRKQTAENGPQPKRTGIGTVIASLAALGSVVLASSCCLPLLPFVFAAGAAGTSAFFVKVRPFLLALSLLSIAFGFYQAWRAKQCKCKPNVLSTILLWFSTVVVVAFILFPQVIANFIANLLAG